MLMVMLSAYMYELTNRINMYSTGAQKLHGKKIVEFIYIYTEQNILLAFTHEIITDNTCVITG